jgi:hypothetical protein
MPIYVWKFLVIFALCFGFAFLASRGKKDPDNDVKEE